MGLILLLVFIGIPIVEIAIMIQAGRSFGLWPTVGAIVFTAVLGAALVRYQGFSTLMRARQSLNDGQLPINEVFDGLCILVAGAMLLTPGFVTDIIGFLLLIPGFRGVLRTLSGHHLVAKGQVDGWNGVAAPRPQRKRRGDTTVIEGEYEDISDRDDESNDPPHRPSGADRLTKRPNEDKEPDERR